MVILKSNFESALQLAIKQQENSNRHNGIHYETFFIAGLKDILKASQTGQRIEVKR